MTIIAKNQTAGALPLTQLPVPNNEIPASGQVTLTDYATVTEIQDDTELATHITAGDCILNDGVSDLTQAQSLAIATTVTALETGNALTEAIVNAKGDLLAATGADAVDRVAIGTNGDILTADSSEATGVKWVAPETANIAQYRQTGNLNISTNATTVVLDANDFEDSNYTRSGPNITINATGVYRISYNVYFRTGGNFRRTVDAWCAVNGTEITPSRSADYSRNNLDDEGSAGATFLVQLTASNVVTLVTQSTGSTGTAIGQGNRMWITLEFVRF
mgnify:FL=1|jgi:hypothetical protein